MTNPHKAAYNRIYNRTTFSLGRPRRGKAGAVQAIVGLFFLFVLLRACAGNARTDYNLVQEPIVYCERDGDYFIAGTQCPEGAAQITEREFDRHPSAKQVPEKHSTVARIPRPDRRGDAVEYGSGFAIAPNGYFATNYHVVKTCSRLSLKLANVIKTAHVVDVDEGADLSIVQADFDTVKLALPFRSNTLRLGEPVVVDGYPELPILSSSGMVTTGIVSALAWQPAAKFIFEMTAPIHLGNSGGPVLDSSGNLIGITAAKAEFFTDIGGNPTELAENVAYAIKAERLALLMKFNDIPVIERDSIAQMSVPDISAEAAKSTAIVICWAK